MPLTGQSPGTRFARSRFALVGGRRFRQSTQWTSAVGRWKRELRPYPSHRCQPFGYFVRVALPNREPTLRVVAGQPGDARVVTDEVIIAAFARRDRRAAEMVYEHLVGVVDSTLYRVIGRRETDHDDLVQTTFEQIIITLSRSSFAGGCSLRGWAASIACHVGLNAIRSRRRARRVFATRDEAELIVAERAGFANPEMEAIARTELHRLRSELADMDPDRAETIVIHDLLGVSLAETAKLMRVSLSAAQSRLVRGRREIRARMADREEEP
jgi:RNA polymerase sigma-70 factor, ECF subfamily